MRLKTSSGLTAAFMLGGDLSEEDLQILFGQNVAGGSMQEVVALQLHLA